MANQKTNWGLIITIAAISLVNGIEKGNSLYTLPKFTAYKKNTLPNSQKQVFSTRSKSVLVDHCGKFAKVKESQS